MKRSITEDFGFETRMIHAGSEPEPVTGARQTPIYQNASYVFHDVDHAASLYNLQTFGFIYSRLTNPTVAVLEERLASLDGARGATCCASGHAAQILTFFAFMEPGDEFVASNKLYGGSLTQFGKTFKKFDWHSHLVDTDDLPALRATITPKCKALFVESLANPGGVVSDLEPLAEIAHEVGLVFIVDNTLATPYLCQPFDWGADLVVYSTTKFLSGNGTSLGGAVVDSGRFDWSQNDKFGGLSRPEPAYHGLIFHETFGDLAFTTHAHAVGLRDLGPAMAPTNAFQTLLGIETLSLRMERHCANARAVAEFLEKHEAVAWVSYAGLPSSRYHGLAAKYLPKGAGSVFTFGAKGGFETCVRVVEGCEIFSHLANVGDARSLILHPASTTHRQLSEEQRDAAGAGPEVIRLSIGLESVDDLIRDLDQALRRAGQAPP
jgi:O-acetylhomoserine (thiol)-lyase